MMKLYQFELFLFLLLIIFIRTHQQSPLSDEPIEIKVVSQIKQYLYDFGYTKESKEYYDEVLDKDTISAIKTYQQFFNLEVTGDLSTETLQQISIPRCGIPDMNFEYGFTDVVNISKPKGNKWFPKGTKTLTYGFLPESEISIYMTSVLRNAFTRWSTTTKIMSFTETTYDDADIKVGFYYLGYDDIVYRLVVADSVISLQVDSKVKSGVIRFGSSNRWVLPTDNLALSWEIRYYDLESMAMHQIGHLLGLDHSSHNESIMYPAILPLQQRKVKITDSDNKTIQQLYSSNAIKDSENSGYSGSFKLFGSTSGFLTSLFLGFTFVGLLN